MCLWLSSEATGVTLAHLGSASHSSIPDKGSVVYGLVLTVGRGSKLRSKQHGAQGPKA